MRFALSCPLWRGVSVCLPAGMRPGSPAAAAAASDRGNMPNVHASDTCPACRKTVQLSRKAESNADTQLDE
jgi:hypothetical protein